MLQRTKRSILRSISKELVVFLPEGQAEGGGKLKVEVGDISAIHIRAATVVTLLSVREYRFVVFSCLTMKTRRMFPSALD